jgi:DnaJ-class molecular chaperone
VVLGRDRRRDRNHLGRDLLVVAVVTPAEAAQLFRRLGVDPAAITAGDRAVYCALVKRFHPDRNPRGAELMAQINAARAALKEPPK